MKICAVSIPDIAQADGTAKRSLPAHSCSLVTVAIHQPPDDVHFIRVEVCDFLLGVGREIHAVFRRMYFGKCVLEHVRTMIPGRITHSVRNGQDIQRAYSEIGVGTVLSSSSAD